MATKFLRVTVSKTMSTELYIEVDESFDMMKDIRKLNLGKVAHETTDRFDWDVDDDSDVQMESVHVIDAKEASHYKTFDAREQFPPVLKEK